MIHKGLWKISKSSPPPQANKSVCVSLRTVDCVSVRGWITGLYCVVFGLSQECFPPEQVRPASVRIGLGFSFSWNTFCSLLQGPTRDHSADIFRGHVPRASVTKGEGQWRVWCYINTWLESGGWRGREKRKNPGWPWWVLEGLTLRNCGEHPTDRGLKMAARVYIRVHPHLCSSVPHTPLSSGTVKCVQGKERKEEKKAD